jgi:hypothetical protein
LTPGSRILNKKSPDSEYFRELSDHFLGLKYFNYLLWIRIRDGKILIRDGKILNRDGKILIRDGKILIRDGKILNQDGKILIRDGNILIRDGNILIRDKHPGSATGMLPGNPGSATLLLSIIDERKFH